jgi:hypothetical protein
MRASKKRDTLCKIPTRTLLASIKKDLKQKLRFSASDQKPKRQPSHS